MFKKSLFLLVLQLFSPRKDPTCFSFFPQNTTGGRGACARIPTDLKVLGSLRVNFSKLEISVLARCRKLSDTEVVRQNQPNDTRLCRRTSVSDEFRKGSFKDSVLSKTIFWRKKFLCAANDSFFFLTECDCSVGTAAQRRPERCHHWLQSSVQENIAIFS